MLPYIAYMDPMGYDSIHSIVIPSCFPALECFFCFFISLMTYSHSNSDEIIPPVNLGSTGNPQMGIPPKPQGFLPLCPCKKPHLDSEMRTKGCAYNWFLFQKPIETYRNPEVDRIFIIFGPKKRGCRWKIKSQHGRNCLP